MYLDNVGSGRKMVKIGRQKSGGGVGGGGGEENKLAYVNN